MFRYPDSRNLPQLLVDENMTKIEHVNITVPDIDEAIRFFSIVAPDFKVRRDEVAQDGYRWAHIANDDCYFALQESHPGAKPEKPRTPYRNYGMNHIGLVVENLEEIEGKLRAAGYQRSIDAPIEKYRRRRYFLDRFGFEWELVEYSSDVPDQKFAYE